MVHMHIAALSRCERRREKMFRTHGQLITLPRKIYELVRSQPVRMELDYSLTLFHIEAADTIAALKGDKRIANIGWCKTRLDYNGNRVELGCIKPGKPPFCATLWPSLKNTVSGLRRDPASNPCLPDYTPYTTDIQGSAITQFGSALNFRDPRGLAKYPVDSSQLDGRASVNKDLQSSRPLYP